MSADESAAPGDTVTAPTGLAGFGGQADGMNLRAQTPALIADLKSLIQRLPRPNFDLLHEICRLLRCTSDAHQTTRMPLSNLLVVFSPSLKLNSALLKALVEEQEVIFEQPEESGGGSPLPPPYQSRAPVVPSSAPPPEPEKTLRRRSATIPLPSAPNAHLASRDPPPPVPPLPPQLVSQPPTSGGPTPHPQTPPAAGTQSHPPTSTRSIRSLLAITSPNPAPTTPARPPRPPRRPSIGLLFSKQSSPNGSTTSSPAPHDAQRCFLPMNTVASTLAAHAPNPSPLTPLPSSGGTTAATPHMNERNHLPIADLLRPSPPIPVPNRPAHRAESPHQRSVGSVSSTASSPPPRVGLFESRMSQSRVEDEWMKAVLEAAGAEKKHPR
ncbi:hypothetical protein BOTBODRAFT_201847 [Botryobasidium botryosum FD-172 SS1]|uniref:Rho-GAP domain-containing protein n=1 Tax=Botryobasidium botryosum (strain FD-172 SS1) TaxID=930990 RepID=A0A067N379_BOTB1|nr:hypothetical protein BOTBODRAFT_201847 [Botryobasidium botryosum FD-172 SS1]